MKPQTATLLAIQYIDIHGSKFCDLTFALDSKPDAPKTSRLGAESVSGNPQAGDKISVSLILGQLTSVEKNEI